MQEYMGFYLASTYPHMIQMRIHKPVKHLRWIVCFAKIVNG